MPAEGFDECFGLLVRAYGESWPPTESYASSMHQRKHRIVRVWKLITSKPAQVDGLGSDLGADQLMGDHEVLDVEVIGGPYVPAGHLVLGQQQRSRLQRKIEKPALLLSLPNRGCLQSGVGRFDVATGLQPASNPGMQRQQHLAVAWSTDQRAGKACRLESGIRNRGIPRRSSGGVGTHH